MGRGEGGGGVVVLPGVPLRVGERVLPPQVVEQRDVVRQQHQVGVGRRALENGRDGGRARLAALRLEQLDHGQGLELHEARRRVHVVGVVVHVQVHGAHQRRLLLAPEELAENRGHGDGREIASGCCRERIYGVAVIGLVWYVRREKRRCWCSCETETLVPGGRYLNILL